MIPFDIDSDALKVILESELPTGNVAVTRDGPDANQGYTWFVTFISANADVALLEADGRSLTGVLYCVVKQDLSFLF